MTTNFANHNFEQRSMADFAEEAYLNYSMYVILDRALPHIGDGLKPVQRRIVYAMSELGLSAASKHKKSARTVGDVLGKYHPHGDSACYEALVLMAQSFSYRYPLIDGQGNFGSLDNPKSFAAMRYTESKLSRYAEVLLKEVSDGTVDWQPNFDGTLNEPVRLPARLPNILLNGGTGIAVGMATDIPPHNLIEVATATCALIDNPDLTIEALHEIIPAPDFPTGGEIITSKSELLKIYTQGTGSVRARARYRLEEGKIIIYELPYQVSGEKIQMDIAAQMQAKKLPMIDDIRDESDHEDPVRIVLIPRSNRIDAELVMNHLFVTTDLEKSFRVNLNMIGLDNRPKVKNIHQILTEWIQFRRQMVTKRLNYQLDKIETRLHILDGLLIAFLNLDEVIRIIRFEEEPKAALIKQFDLSERQAEAILETKLRHLAKLEETKLSAEQADLNEKRLNILELLNNPKKLDGLIKKEIKEDITKFGDPRRSKLIERETATAIDESELITAETVTVVVSKMGWVRAAKGDEIDPAKLSYKTGDDYLTSCIGKNNQQTVFFDTSGRSFSLATHTLASARSAGEPLTGRFNLEKNVQISHAILNQEEAYYLLCASNGYGYIIQYSEFITRQKAGKAIVNLSDNALLFAPQLAQKIDEDYIVVATHLGRLLIVPLSQLPILTKGKGNQIIAIPAARFKKHEDYLIASEILPSDATLVIKTGRRKMTLKPADWQTFIGERGKRGKELGKGIMIDEMEIILGKQ